MYRILLPLVLLTPPIAALEPKDVFVVANKDSKESLAVAEHYLAKRKVPKENLIALSLPTTEDITRADYDAKLASPLRDALKDKKDACKVLLTVYGVPLRVGVRELTAEEKSALEATREQLDEAKKSGDAAKVQALSNKQMMQSGALSTAAVDSELMLLWWPKYDPNLWVKNPLYWQVSDEQRQKAPPVLLTSRLDGPTPDIAKRLVDDAVAVEATGLSGKAYFDARGLKWDGSNPNPTGYEAYDESFREAAALMTKAGLSVTLDDKDPVFAANTCPDAALYAGWYSVANFVDSASYVKGAVAWHLASNEAVSLRKTDTKYWCPNLLQKGVAVTLGPVGEPFSFGFPKPAEFFGLLATGKYTVVECYVRTTYLTSWMMTLIGDPLYNPFAKSPKLKEADVASSPKGSAAFK